MKPKRGRPTTGQAQPPASRMMRLRERALTAIAEGRDLATVTDTGLLEGLRVAYRQGQVPVMAAIAQELVIRANRRAVGGVQVEMRYTVAESAREVSRG